MNTTILLWVALIALSTIVLILFLNHIKLKRKFKNYNPNPIFGPGRYNYGQNHPDIIFREQKRAMLRQFLTFKWVWYWTTKEYRYKRRKRKEVSDLMMSSIERRKKAKLLREKQNQAG